MNPSLLIAIALLIIIGVCAAQPAQIPLDTLRAAYAPYIGMHDELAFPLKIKSLSTDPYKFWRGGKDLFFNWAKTHCNDWLADRQAYSPIHADLHFGNIGVYAQRAGWGKTAFGMVDFDDASELPFQFELLQGLITVKLVARQNGITLSPLQQLQLAEVLVGGYRAGIQSNRNATELLADEPLATKLLSRAGVGYEAELQEITANDRFLPTVRNARGKLKEIYRPTTIPSELFATAAADALAHAPQMADMFRFGTAAEIRNAILDTALRTRFGSAGSQGLKKYCVLLRAPLKQSDSNIVLYFKQEIPTAAERSGIVPPDARPPARRAKEIIDQLTSPNPLINSWCDIGGESYLVSLKEPWSSEIDFQDIVTPQILIDAAKLLGTVAGAAQQRCSARPYILQALKPDLQKTLADRSDAYLSQLLVDFHAFTADPRVREAARDADAMLENIEQSASR